MEKTIQWLLLSSADPTKMSLAIKGILMGIIPVIVSLTGLTGIAGVDASSLTIAVDAIASIVQVALTIVSSAMTLYGLIRKLWTTIVGENEVIHAQDRGDL